MNDKSSLKSMSVSPVNLYNNKTNVENLTLEKKNVNDYTVNFRPKNVTTSIKPIYFEIYFCRKFG